MKTVYYHQNSPSSPCADGVTAAALYAFLEEEPCRTVPICHGPDLDALVPHENAVFVDTCPSTRLDEWRALGAVVYDHHVSRRADIESFAGAYGDGISGAETVMRHVGLGLSGNASLLVRHVGIRDTWRKDDPNWSIACETSAAVRFWGLYWTKRLIAGDMPWDTFAAVGAIELERYRARVHEAMANAVEWPPQRGKVKPGAILERRLVFVPDVGVTSDGIELLDDPTAILIGYKVLKNEVVYSMRTRGDFDLATFAKLQGGGGHRQAAGFQARFNPLTDSPVQTFFGHVDNADWKRNQ